MDDLSLPVDLPSKNSLIEVDTFCTGCFYNLHGQVVSIDDRLQIPICRCPECGKFHPAGTGVTASSIWLRRWASILMASWILAVIGGAIFLAGGCFALGTSSVEAYTYGESVPIGKNQWSLQMHLRPWQTPTDPDSNINGCSTMVYISLGSVAIGLIAGVLVVTLMWHWKKLLYLRALAVPVISAALLALIYHELAHYDGIRLQSMMRVLTQTGFQCIGILIGILIGRAVSRAVVTMVIPPKPRQALSFLWTVDGKKPPML